MNKIVREHYPVSKLPEDLRVGLDQVDSVRITVEVLSPAGGEDRPLTRIMEEMRACRRSDIDPVGRIREIRDEWHRRQDLIERIRRGTLE